VVLHNLVSALELRFASTHQQADLEEIAALCGDRPLLRAQSEVIAENRGL
jgi:hypothetical protein